MRKENIRVAQNDRTFTFSWISCCGPWCCHSPSSAQPSVPPRLLQVNKSPCQMSSLLFFDIGQINSAWTVGHHRVYRQIAKLFLQSSELGLQQASVPPHPLVQGGWAHSLAGEGLGDSQFRRGDIHRGTLYI
jgi:hypothetical protein